MTDLRYPRTARVRTRSEFTRVFDAAQRVAHPLMSLHWTRDDGVARLGLAVSRKVDACSPGRNRIKRVLREAFRQRRAGIAPGAYVVVARPAAKTATNGALRDAFVSLLQRCGALPPPGLTGTMPAPPKSD